MVLNIDGREEIYHLQMTNQSKLIFYISSWYGKKFFQIRQFYLTKNGAWYPSKKGLSVHKKHWIDLMFGLMKSLDRLKETSG